MAISKYNYNAQKNAAQKAGATTYGGTTSLNPLAGTESTTNTGTTSSTGSTRTSGTTGSTASATTPTRSISGRTYNVPQTSIDRIIKDNNWAAIRNMTTPGSVVLGDSNEYLHGLIDQISDEQILTDKQNEEIQKFQENLPGYIESMQGDTLTSAKKQIASEQKDIAESANRRGLLYSGIKRGAQQQAAGTIAGETAQKLPQITEALNSQLDSMRDALAQYKLGRYEQQVTEAKTAYNQALSDYKQSTDVASNVVQLAAMYAMMA